MDVTPESVAGNISDITLEEWRGKRERLEALIGMLRVVGPLLHHRVVKDGAPGRVQLDGCALAVHREVDAVYVRLTRPAWCLADEAHRLAIVAAASISPTSDWYALPADEEEHMLVRTGFAS